MCYNPFRQPVLYSHVRKCYIMTKPHLQIFCENIRYLRKNNNLSRTAMAKRLGVSVRTLDSIEAGILPQNTSVHIFFRTNQAFGIPIERLFAPLQQG